MVDLLVHESSHVLLFGVSADGALTENSGSERYDSPLRPDKRPIDGIFHACFVATRVHLAMNRLLASGALSEAEAKLALERRDNNAEAARNSIEELESPCAIDGTRREGSRHASRLLGRRAGALNFWPERPHWARALFHARAVGRICNRVADREHG